ncbi:MAG: hypothetical protein J6W75_08700 [Bacteroidaceae bacterium]|nr:hypothetical protein [Bacteroidaceae bacterium]
MKKNYIQPSLMMLDVQAQEIIALSTFTTAADDSAVLVKDNDWDIWSESEVEE